MHNLFHSITTVRFISIAMILVTITSIIMACQKEIDIKIPNEPSRLVINAQWEQNRLFSARISRSVSVNEPIRFNEDRFTVKNALVLVKQNNIVVDTLRWDSARAGYFTIRNRRTGLNASYGIEVSAPGFPSASAVSTMPAVITRPTAITIRRNVRTGSNNELLSEIAVTIRDNPGADFYLLRFKTAFGQPFDCIFSTESEIEKIEIDNPLEPNPCFRGDRILFTDRNFNSNERTLLFYTNDSNLAEFDDAPTQTKKRPWLECLYINESYYRYIKSSSAYEGINGNSLAEPVNVTTNVNGGYGFFTTFTQAIDTLRR